MKVRELIRLLEECDGDADVLLAIQPTWPFEHTIRGVATREEAEEDDEDDANRDVARCGRRNDVFLVEGSQLRYGSKSLWDNVMEP